MKRIPDFIIAMGVIAGATGIATGHRLLGVLSLSIAILVGWKRDWGMGYFEELLGNSESTAARLGAEVDLSTDESPSEEAGGSENH